MPAKKEVVTLVNLETGEVIEADSYRLREQCIPVGYKNAEEMTVEEWVEALKNARGKAPA